MDAGGQFIHRAIFDLGIAENARRMEGSRTTALLALPDLIVEIQAISRVHAAVAFVDYVLVGTLHTRGCVCFPAVINYFQLTITCT